MKDVDRYYVVGVAVRRTKDRTTSKAAIVVIGTTLGYGCWFYTSRQPWHVSDRDPLTGQFNALPACLIRRMNSVRRSEDRRWKNNENVTS